MLQIRAGKPVFGDLADAPVFHVAAEDGIQHHTDLALALAAFPLDDHHALPLCAGDQAITEIFLQSRDVLFVKQVMQKPQPVLRLRCFWVISDRQAVADNFLLALDKRAVHKQRAVGQMDSVLLGCQVNAGVVEFQKFHNVVDGMRDVLDRVVLQLIVDGPAQRKLIRHAPLQREESVAIVGELVAVHELLTECCFYNILAVPPDWAITQLVQHGSPPPASAAACRSDRFA